MMSDSDVFKDRLYLASLIRERDSKLYDRRKDRLMELAKARLWDPYHAEPSAAYTWDDIGRKLGISSNAARKQYGRLMDRNLWLYEEIIKVTARIPLSAMTGIPGKEVTLVAKKKPSKKKC